MSQAVEFNLAEIEAEIERRERGEQRAQEADRLSRSLSSFVRASWHVRIVRRPGA